jgi:aspartate/methionine/tyrosine aminotransferase
MPASPPTAATSPFSRLTDRLAGIAPGKPPIAVHIGEPQEKVPDFVAPALLGALGGFGRYPQIRGTEPFRAAVGAWLDRRYGLAGAIDPAAMVLPLNGSREGLFLAAVGAAGHLAKERPAVIVPNPFYQAYAAGAEVSRAELVLADCPERNGFLPDLAAIAPELLKRTVAAYVCAPANPQGGFADRAYWEKAVALARRHRFMLLADECYSEIYRDAAPEGVLPSAAAGGFANVVAFHSLSKRSGLPGLRAGFAAGDPGFLAAWTRLRNMAAPQVPEPLQAVAAAAYGDEAHVAAGRAAYNARYALAERIIGNRFGYRTPPGGFFLWLDMSGHGGGEAAAIRLWREAGVKALPGGYLALPQPDGSNPGEPFLRIAMVQDLATTEEVLTRLAQLFD